MKFTTHILSAFIIYSSALYSQGIKTEVYQSPLAAAINHISLSPDGEMLVAADTSGYVFYWARDGSLRKIIRAHILPLTQMTISADGRFLATASADAQVNIMDFTEGETLSSFTAGQDVLALSFSGNFLLFARQDGVYRVPVRGGQKPEKIYSGLLTAAGRAGDYFIVADENGLTVLGSSGKQQKAQPCRPVRQIECRGDRFAVYCGDGTLEFYEVNASGIEKKNSSNHQPVPSRMLITDDKKVLLLQGAESMLWNPLSGKFKKPEGLPAGFTAAGYGDNGNYYAGDGGGRITSFRINDAESHQTASSAGAVKKQSGIEIRTGSGGVPKSFNGRPVQAAKPVEVSAASFDIFVWDNEREDGDSISLSLNGKWLLENYPITTEKKKLSVTLTPGTANYLVLYAHNLGKFPPNTAVISFNDGTAERKLTLESDLKKCGAISFILKK